MIGSSPRMRSMRAPLVSLAIVVALLVSVAPIDGTAGAAHAGGPSVPEKQLPAEPRFEIVEPSAPAVLGDDEGGEPDSVIVRFRDDVRPGAAGRARAHERTGGRAARGLRFARGFEVVEVPPGITAEKLAERYASDPDVLYAEPNAEVSLALTPDDTYFPRQWSLRNEGQHKGTPGADIGILEAWQATRGSDEVVVAVIDTGVDHTHEDLASRMWDGLGYDFYDDDDDPMDTSGHGTHVASTIAAAADDGFGVAGVAPGVRIMALRAFGANGNGSLDAIIDSIAYAEENGADIVNASWVLNSDSQALRDAIADSSALVVAAAGNHSQNSDTTPRYPAAWNDENILAVAATDRFDQLAGFSNYGPGTIDIAAPGADILGALPGRETVHFHDDFSDMSAWVAQFSRTNEWGLSAEWFASAPFALADSPNGPYANNEDSFVRLAQPIDLSGVSDATLELALWLDTEKGFDGVVARARAGAGNWEEVASWSGSSGGEFLQFSVDLSEYAGESEVGIGFGLLSDSSIVGQGAFIDDVRVVSSAPAGPSNIHGYMSGTSMAAPHAAGAAALLLSEAPELAASELKEAIRKSAKPVPSLSGTVATGARLDAGALFREPEDIPVRATTAKRLWGSDRYSTAVATAREAYPGFAGVEHVVIASGEDRAAADPLAAAGLAGVLDAPILLVRSGRLPDTVRSALASMPQDATVVIVGGTSAVSPSVALELSRIGRVSNVERVQGPDRYATARAVADRMGAELKGRGEQMPSTALLANGAEARSFFDALALSAISAENHFPILLLERDRVPAATSAALRDHRLSKRIVGGGDAVVSERVRAQLGAERWAGADRYATAATIASRATAAGYAGYGTVAVAASLPDALTGGAMAGSRGGVLLLTRDDRLTPVTANAIAANRDRITHLYVLGGPASVAEPVRTRIHSLLK